jgi:hypothetical protein
MIISRKKGVQNKIVRDYVLPDYTHIKRGYVRSPECAAQQPASGNEQVNPVLIVTIPPLFLSCGIALHYSSAIALTFCIFD